MSAENKSTATGADIAQRVEASTGACAANATAWAAMKKRHLAFAAYLALSLAACWPTLKALAHTALSFDFCSQILVVPFISIWLVYWRRREIFRAVKSGFAAGGVILFAGVVVYWLGRSDAWMLNDYDALSLATLGLVLIWAAGFCGVYGQAASRAAAFPLGFLILTVPIPNFALDRAVFYLQVGSTAISHWLFEVAGVPVMRTGFVLALPGLTIEVAKECSSIRSSIALVITCLLAGYLFLRSPWKRAALVLLALPLSIFKNGVRIAVLSLLTIYVNPAFMRSDLHRDGGILFYLLALAILYPVFRWFEKLEHRAKADSNAQRVANGKSLPSS